MHFCDWQRQYSMYLFTFILNTRIVDHHPSTNLITSFFFYLNGLLTICLATRYTAIFNILDFLIHINVPLDIYSCT
jgi:hypothetical protein